MKVAGLGIIASFLRIQVCYVSFGLLLH